jgi:hypothetical protein
MVAMLEMLSLSAIELRLELLTITELVMLGSSLHYEHKK